MNCDKFRECLDNYENITKEEKLEMTAHTQSCEECRKELDFMLSIIDTTKSLPRIELPSDFMDKLNVRIDMEEKKKQQISKRLIANIRKNWKQYTASVACFALVVAITANGKMFVDKMNDNHDGIIQEETTATGEPSSEIFETESSVPTLSDAGNEKMQDTSVKSEENAVFSTPIVSPTSIPKNDIKKTVAVSSAKKTESKNDNVKSEQNIQNSKTETLTNVSENVKAEPKGKILSENVQETSEPEYGIAIARVISEANAEPSIPEDIGTARNARGVYSLVEDDNFATAESVEPKAIGKLKIASDDAQKAMDVMQQYSCAREGDLYTTDSLTLGLILSGFNSEDIEYTNYTMENDGIVKFKVVFN